MPADAVSSSARASASSPRRSSVKPYQRLIARSREERAAAVRVGAGLLPHRVRLRMLAGDERDDRGHREEAAVVERDQVAALERPQRQDGALGRRLARVRALDRDDRGEHLRAEALDVVVAGGSMRSAASSPVPKSTVASSAASNARRTSASSVRQVLGHGPRDGGALGRLAGEEQRAHEVLRGGRAQDGVVEALVGQAEVLRSPPGRT